MNIPVTSKIVPVYYVLLKACVQIRLNSNRNAIIFSFHVNILLIFSEWDHAKTYVMIDWMDQTMYKRSLTYPDRFYDESLYAVEFALNR